MSSPVLSVHGICSGYGGGNILRDISLDLEAGEILTVLGKNGMGKSTLVKTIMGFVKPNSGRIALHGDDITSAEPHKIARRSIAYTPQEFAIFRELTVQENLRLGVGNDDLLKQRLGDVEAAFPRMIERLSQRAGTLSGGEQKMLLLCRAIVSRPQIMLIDEISEGLQPTMVERMAEILRKARDRGVGILLIEQNLDFALSVADRYAVIQIGEIVESGRVASTETAAQLEKHLRI
ncbi:ABC transporter ATP-binding protein [Fulvimarina endophytica]|uniref:ABC transporter ATP-binding protein n=1 Tax=Fulvimarina endophytica TaxID=2293836 RepID=A0A371XBD3_9HYPH|nr:ABC transporter ATP-binding protein [Fulvimarina endophytica]